MVPLSSRASVSEARDPYSAVSRYCLRSMGPRLRGDDVLMCGHVAEESTMVPLSSRASVSEARDPHSAVSRYCCGVWIPAGACPRADGDGDDVLMCCRRGRA